MKMSNQDLTKESINVQDAFDEVTRILNNGLYEIQQTSASEPDYDAPNETTFVLSLFGATYRLYVSYAGDWYYTALTKL